VPIVEIPGGEITDWDSFHDVFAARCGFPDFYGRNMNAWIDCLTYADDDDGMRAFVVPPGDVLTFHVADVSTFAARCPDVYEALIECAAFVNFRRIDAGARPILALSFHKSNPPAAKV
jgi:hypothetical protein